MRGALKLAIASHMPAKRRDLDRTLFVVTHMIDALAHGVVSGRPRGLSIAAAKDEAVRAILTYLRA